MDYCPDCGSPMPEGADWCRKCRWNEPVAADPGAPTENEEPVPDSPTDIATLAGDISAAARAKYLIMAAIKVMLIAVIIVLSVSLKRIRTRGAAAPLPQESIIYIPAEDIDPDAVDPSGWTTGEIVAYAAGAVNKTKAYKGSLTAEHTETTDATVTSVTGGPLVRNFAGSLVRANTKPLDETLVYSGGSAINSEGETVGILLPANGEFSLGEPDVSSASAARNGSDIVIVINLAAEVGSMDAPAEHNNGVIGNPAAFFAGSGAATVGKVGYTCVGSTVKLTVGQDGLVRSASYSVPLHIVGEVSAGAINGSVTVDGVLNEIWILTSIA